MALLVDLVEQLGQRDLCLLLVGHGLLDVPRASGEGILARIDDGTVGAVRTLFDVAARPSLGVSRKLVRHVR
ncbi:MAG: hypothetical protein ACRDK0_08170 [Solirubrobacteraceae bacterium]